MRRAASATSVAPQARYVSLLPPKVAVPKLRADTRKPDPPIRRYSITDILSFALVDACAGIRADAAQVFWLVRSYLYLRSRRVMQFADRRDIAPTIAPPQNRYSCAPPLSARAAKCRRYKDSRSAGSTPAARSPVRPRRFHDDRIHPAATRRRGRRGPLVCFFFL